MHPLAKTDLDVLMHQIEGEAIDVQDDIVEQDSIIQVIFLTV